MLETLPKYIWLRDVGFRESARNQPAQNKLEARPPRSDPMTDSGGNASKTTKRKREDPEALLRKRTLILGEEESSSSSAEETATDTNKDVNENKPKAGKVDLDSMFPGWREDDQHLYTCRCDFCKVYHGLTDESDEDEPIAPTSTADASTASNSVVVIDVDAVTCPQSPVAA